MKSRTILITSFLLLITFELINSAKTKKTKLLKKSKRFMQDEEEEEEEQPKSTELPTTIITTIIPTQRETQESATDPFQDVVPDNQYSDYQLCKEFLKPSTAFTVILMIYMVLIIVGGVLVLVLLKKDLEQ